MAGPLSQTPDAATPIVPDAFTTESLKRLQSVDERRLLDVVDKLRGIGLNGTIELPQLVVCGDQSSGKSSVLEAITEIPFPRKAGLCTRFATEIIMRCQPTSCLTIRINPCKRRPSFEQAELTSFNETITDFSELPHIMELATTKMGLGKIGESAAFSRDILKIDICGPSRFQLTLVDLPGLIHSATRASSDADKELILELVQEYMRNPRSIILAVVSAKNDAANQIVLSLFKKIDTRGSRTLGIITKPDCMSSGDEQFWFELAKNNEVPLERGWHIVKNRSETEMCTTFAERNQAEKAFFEKGRYQELPRDCLGVETLRGRLSELLLSHLIQELPSLKDEMTKKLSTTLSELSRLGMKRSTISAQRQLLTKISGDVQSAVVAALNGNYGNSFFGAIKPNTPAANSEANRRLRSVIVGLNTKFEENIRLRGHKYYIVSGNGSSPQEKEEERKAYEIVMNSQKDASTAFLPKPIKLTQADGLAWVKRILEQTRGLELPGTVQYTLVSQIFWEQIDPWREIAMHHINKVAYVCKEFACTVIKNTAPLGVQDRIYELGIDAAMNESLKAAKFELDKIVQRLRRHPSTYNHYFTDNIEKARMRIYQDKLATATQSSKTTEWTKNGERTMYDPVKLAKAMEEQNQTNMEDFAASEALLLFGAIYKEKMKVFVANVTEAVIEDHLVESLPQKLISPLSVSKMTDEEVAEVAAESPEVIRTRAELEHRKSMLESGLQTFSEAVSGLK